MEQFFLSCSHCHLLQNIYVWFPHASNWYYRMYLQTTENMFHRHQFLTVFWSILSSVVANKDKIPTIFTVSVLHHYQYVYTVCSMNHKFTMKHVAFPICKTYDKTYIHLCFGDWMASFSVILVMNRICLKIIYNLFCLTVKAAAQRFCASVEYWLEIKHKKNLSLIIILKIATNQKKVVITNCRMIKCTFSLWVSFFGLEPLNTSVSFFHWCEILVSHCDTIFLFQHAFTLPFIAMFSFMDDSKFMTILHECFLLSMTFYYNYN